MDKQILMSFADIPEETVERFRETFQQSKQLMTYYSCALLEVETKFRVLNQQFSLEQEHNPIETIKTRLKSMESIMDKLYRKKLPFEVSAVEECLTDVAGIRVICPFIEDIYRLADCLLQQDDVKLIRIKDYIKNPKENGYRSLHLIVEIPIFLQNEKKQMKVEVQLRTIAMDFWASLEHKLRYKKNIPAEQEKLIREELYDCSIQSAELDKRMQDIRNMIIKANGDGEE